MAGWWCDRRAFHDTVATLVVPPIPTGLRVERLGMHEHGFFFDPEPRRELFLRIERPCAKAVSAVPCKLSGQDGHVSLKAAGGCCTGSQRETRGLCLWSDHVFPRSARS